MSNINVINNTGKEFNVIVNENNGALEIVINMAHSDYKLPNNIKPGDVFKDVDGDEYILLFYLKNGDAAILRKDNLLKMDYGKNNNYDGCKIDKHLTENYLPELERKFGVESIAEHEVDLLSLDGEDDYGIIKRKVSIPTFDVYRKHKKTIKQFIKELFLLATPDSTPSSCGSDCVGCVRSSGGVGCGWCNYVKGVRPFFVLKSSIFESSDNITTNN